MIKKYNQFVKENVNEDFQMSGDATEIAPAEPITKPDTTERPKTDRPSPFRKDRTSPIPAPAKAFKEEEENGDEYIGTKMMAELSNRLGVGISQDGSIDYQGQKVNFFSETEKFHIGKEQFDTVDDVVDYLEVENPTDEVDEISDEDTDFEDDDEYDVDLEEGEIDNQDKFESKSYRRTFKR